MATRTRGDGWVGTGAGDCPRCGAAYAPLQEYCLECGLRLPEDPVAEPPPAAPTLLGVPPGAAWPLLATLAVAVIAIATVLGLRLTGDGPRDVLVVTTSAPTVVPATQPPPAEEPPVATLPTPVVPPPPATPPGATTATTPTT
ncbi:MAG: hypothetical protein ICV64_07200, partial [Thermoleophilia bacterium]|nr:hypothetical protein [Thermoleophilia bacterium]